MDIDKLINHENVVLFGYTSNCGTCKIAEQMLDIVSETLKDLQVIKVNLSLETNIVNQYKLKSTPAFILLKNKEVFDYFYAFHSVTYLYEKITKLMEK